MSSTRTLSTSTSSTSKNTGSGGRYISESKSSWLWWWQRANEEKSNYVNKKCKMDTSAFLNCKKAYGDETAKKACDTLRNQVLHCYSKNYCSEVAKEYERCYHVAVNRGRYLPNAKTGERACEKEVRRIEKCLRRARALPAGLA